MTQAAEIAAPGAPAPPAPIPALAIPLLSLAAFASGVSLRVTDPLLPRLAGEFSISLGAASHVVTVYSVAYGLAQLFFGPLGDRYGKYRVVSWACAAAGLTSLVCALAPGLDVLLVGRLLTGAASAAAIPLSMAWIGDVVPYAVRQPVIARFLIGQFFGISGGVLLGGLAADMLGRRVPFAIIALVFLAVALGLTLLDRRLPAHARQTRQADGPALRRLVGEFGAVLARPWARVVLLLVYLEGGFVYGAFAFIASHLHTVFGISLSSAGFVVMLFGLGGLVFAAASRRLLRSFGEAGIALGGGILMCLALGAIAAAPRWSWALPGCGVLGLGFYMLHNTLQTHATQMAPERRGAAVATFAACFFLGQSSGVAAAGALVGSLGTPSVIGAGATGTLLVAVAFSALLACSPLAPRRH
ncbi:MAG: MFS transporter [Proteobacteria bacterium]|nr:MFS transporter [Pseudomonadota bacterium]